MSSIFPKNERKQVDLRYHSTTVGRIILFVFWKNSGYQQALSKLTDLYKIDTYDRKCVLKYQLTKYDKIEQEEWKR